jgi:hypothetical protein
MPNHNGDLNRWEALVKGEYREMPGLNLTKAQVRRMWGLEDSECDLVLQRLQASHFLRVTPNGLYVLAGELLAPAGR